MLFCLSCLFFFSHIPFYRLVMVILETHSLVEPVKLTLEEKKVFTFFFLDLLRIWNSHGFSHTFYR